MRKNFFGSIVLLFSLFISVGALAQKQIDDANAEVRNVSGYHGIRTASGIKVYLTQGNSEAVAVSADDKEYRDRIKTVVENGILKIYFDSKGWTWKNGNKHLRAYVSIKNVDVIDASSGSEIKIEGAIKSGKLALGSSSGGMVNGKIDAASLDVDQSSGSIVTISGTVSGKLKIDGSSGSIFRGYDLTVENCDAEASSGAIVQITVNKELSVDASSGGSIKYKGAGSIRDVHTSSGGAVSKAK